jgi:hypothetical protein
MRYVWSLVIGVPSAGVQFRQHRESSGPIMIARLTRRPELQRLDLIRCGMMYSRSAMTEAAT